MPSLPFFPSPSPPVHIIIFSPFQRGRSRKISPAARTVSPGMTSRSYPRLLCDSWGARAASLSWSRKKCASPLTPGTKASSRALPGSWYQVSEFVPWLSGQARPGQVMFGRTVSLHTKLWPFHIIFKYSAIPAGAQNPFTPKFKKYILPTIQRENV